MNFTVTEKCQVPGSIDQLEGNRDVAAREAVERHVNLRKEGREDFTKFVT